MRLLSSCHTAVGATAHFSIAADIPDMFALSVEEEERPDFIDRVDDFRRLRWEAAAAERQAGAAKNRAEAAARAVERRKWEVGGEYGMFKLQKAKGGVDSILGPHLLKKTSALELVDWARRFEGSDDARVLLFKRQKKAYAVRLLYYIRPPFYLKGSKTALIRWKWAVMTELRRFLDRTKYFTEGAMSTSLTTESMALRTMELGQRSLVPLAREDLDVLYENRDEKHHHEDKLYVVQQLLRKWARVRTCESMLHSTAAGCPVCGVILMGGQRDPVEYVRAVNRESGVEKMEKLEQELLYLHAEEAEQQEHVQRCEEKIVGLERVMLKLARDSIQSWWTAVLARRRSLRADGLRRYSLYYYYIRRLCQMKREIDSTIDARMDFKALQHKYSEIVPQLKEYMAKVAADRTDLGVRQGKVFLAKLRKAMARSRRRRYVSVSVPSSRICLVFSSAFTSEYLPLTYHRFYLPRIPHLLHHTTPHHPTLQVHGRGGAAAGARGGAGGGGQEEEGGAAARHAQAGEDPGEEEVHLHPREVRWAHLPVRRALQRAHVHPLHGGRGATEEDTGG